MDNETTISTTDSNSNVAAPASSTEEPSDLPRLRSRVRQQVEQAVMQLPTVETQAYLEACSRCPEVAQTESDPLQFVRYCGFNVYEAARRLCTYWRERKDVFGDQRAFLPLVLTGSGALTKEDVATLQAGYPAILPGATKDGRSIVLLDRRKWLPSSKAIHKVRCSFYVLALLAQDDTGRAQTEKGVVAMILHVAPRLVPADNDYIRRCIALMTQAIPLKFDFHVCAVPSKSPRQPFVIQNIFAASLEMLINNFAHVTVHIEREKGELLEELQEDPGMTPVSIPFDIGGEWKVEVWFKWFREREKMEKEKYKNLLELPRQEAESQPEESKTPEQLEQEKLEKRRLADLMHSRRKRERRRQHVNNVQEQFNRFSQDNAWLKQEEARLQGLLQQANDYISRMKPGDE